MCRVDERVYIGADGHRQRFENAYPCDKAPRGKLCSKVKRRTTEYDHRRGAMSRGDTPSPASNDPPTPTGSGTYYVQPRRPSITGARPSTRDGLKAANPEIVISFGSKIDDGKTRSSLSVSAKSYKHSPKDTNSNASSEFAVGSPGSDASHTIRTGFPEKDLPPTGATFSRSDGFVTTPSFLQGLHYHQAPSVSSYTSSSLEPSLRVTSDPDYDLPTDHKSARRTSTIVHNPPSGNSPSSPTVPRTRTSIPSNAYRTTIVTPQGFVKETKTSDGLYPPDSSDVLNRPTSSHANSGAPEKAGKSSEREQRRKEKDETLRRQEQQELERRHAEDRVKEENIKQVRFELGRAQARAQERAENHFAELQKTRAEEREKARQQKEKEREEQDRKDRKKEREREELEKKERKKEKELEEQDKKERKREKTKPPTNDFTTKRPGQSRRMSMTKAQIEEQRRLLAAEGLHMQGEREAAEAREKLEAAALRQQQQASDYYNLRGGDRSFADNLPPVTRRNSTTRPGGASVNASQSVPVRSNSNRRASIIQHDLPMINTQVAQNYSTRGLPSARQHRPPPVSFPASFHHDQQARPPSTRRFSYTQESQSHPSYLQENHFTVPPTRGSGFNPDDSYGQLSPALTPSTFSQPVHTPSATNRDPWDLRTMNDSIPSTRQAPDSRNTFQRRGEDVINRASVPNRVHMGRAAGFGDDYALASDSENDDMITHRRTRRT